jgi:hypothetical protein
MNPHAHVRSLPPEGARASFGTALQEVMNPHAHIRSLPPEGAQASFGTALQEAV